jgi:predicted transcriptional regulator of viral defense system
VPAEPLIIYSLIVLFLVLLANIMRYLQFQDLFKDFTVISLQEIRSVQPSFQRRRLNDWQEKGYLKKVVKGYYTFADRAPTEETLFEIANRIYRPSYVSFESALAYYDLIPEAVYGITSATTRPTHRFETSLGSFSFRTLTPGLFFGYVPLEYNGLKRFTMAKPEKALLDYMYLNPSIRTDDDFVELRLDPETFIRKVNETLLFEYLGRFGNKSLSVRTNRLWRFIRNA